MNTVLMLSLLILLIAINAFFVLAEFVSISVTPVQLEQEGKEHKWQSQSYRKSQHTNSCPHNITRGA